MADTPTQPGNTNPNQTPPAPNTGVPGDKNNPPQTPPTNASQAQPNPNTGSATNNVPTVAKGNDGKEPSHAPQNPVSTQPSQTLNPELPEIAAGYTRVRVRKGKHKYQKPDGTWVVANIGDEVEGGVNQRTLDIFSDKFEIVR